MASLLRRSAILTVVALMTGVLCSAIRAQQSAATPPAGPAPVPVPAAAAAQAPDVVAYTAATRITDPAARLTALEKFRADFPESRNINGADIQILTMLTTWPDRTEAMGTVLDRILARIPATAASEARLSSTVSAVTPLIAKKLLLDRAEKLLADATAALDFDKFATVSRESAKSRNQPEPTQAALEAQFNSNYRSRGLEALAKVFVAKGDTVKAEDFYKQAIKAAPSNNAIVMGLVDFYTTCNNFDGAEAVLKDYIVAVGTRPGATVTPMIALADLYVKKGDPAGAEALLKEAVAGSATNTAALAPLARLEATRGDNKAALDHFLAAAVSGSLSAANDAAMRSTWAKVHGSDAGLEPALDAMYREKFPNPVTPDKYAKSPKRTDRLVLLEMFTGSGCPPCVAADLALDAAMGRYADDSIIAIAYHENIPQPDPMVVSGGEGRRDYYGPFKGVPTFNIDGGLGQLGGGARAGTPGVYKNYVEKIDKELDTPAQAGLALRATGDGDQIHVTATVSQLPADAKDVRLHLVLVEKELHFMGENGVRLHPMVVRAMAGEKGAGIPVSANGKSDYTFSLAAIQDDLTKTLAAEMVKRHSIEPAGSTPREYVAEGRAYTKIDSSELVVVAFLQTGAYQAPPDPPPAPLPVAGQPPPPRPVPPLTGTNILQASKTDVVFAAAPKGKGGR